MNDPVQIDAIRRLRVRSLCTAATSSGSMGLPTRSSPPDTIAVSANSTASIRAVTAKRVPMDVVTSAPSTDATTNRYDAPNRLASAKTSAGPATSSSFMPSNTTTTTTCSVGMAPAYVAFCGKDGGSDTDHVMSGRRDCAHEYTNHCWNHDSRQPAGAG